MKTINIFAILFIVTCVNTTKSISYSDLAQSLVQLHDVPMEALASLNTVSEGFADSHKTLDSLAAVNLDTCARLEAAQHSVNKGLAQSLKNAHSQIEELGANNKVQAASIKHAADTEAEEEAKIKVAIADIKKEAKELVKKENELEETVNVLLRLKNIAQDELAGKTKITTEMGQYNVVSKHGVSFIQVSNLKQELHSLLQKSHTQSKALISTLIMMASNDDGHYSDPKIVAKILAVLDKIIASNTLKKHNLQGEFAKEKEANKQIIEMAGEMIINVMEGSVKAQSRMEINNKEVLMYNRDIQSIQAAQVRRKGRNEFNQNYCDEQMKMMKTYQTRYAEVASKVNEMKSELA